MTFFSFFYLHYIRQRQLKFLGFLALAGFFCVNIYAASPVGLWHAHSPFFENRVIGVVKISMDSSGSLYGQLVKIIALNGNIRNYGGSTSGPVMMFGYHQSGKKWTGGHIYEQRSAQLYPSELQLDDSGQHLYVTGFLGLLYRTSVWDRTQ